MFEKLRNQKQSAILDPYDLRPTKAKITVSIDLVTQQCMVACDKTLPGIMIAHMLIQAASGCLMEVQRLEAMTVGRGGGLALGPDPQKKEEETEGSNHGEKSNDKSN